MLGCEIGAGRFARELQVGSWRLCNGAVMLSAYRGNLRVRDRARGDTSHSGLVAVSA